MATMHILLHLPRMRGVNRRVITLKTTHNDVKISQQDPKSVFQSPQVKVLPSLILASTI
jgi:hypothetical protein